MIYHSVLREYPCDHYTSVINVTLMNTGCPRAPVHDAALQLLQLLDQRFFGNVGPLPATELEAGKLLIFFSYTIVLHCTSHHTSRFPIVHFYLAFIQLLTMSLMFPRITVLHLLEDSAFLEDFSFAHCQQTSALTNSICM